MQVEKCKITGSQDMAQCTSLKELVEAMQATGLFEVFCVSRGHALELQLDPWGRTRAPFIAFWATAKDARSLLNALSEVVPDLGKCKSRLPSGRIWHVDARFTHENHEFESICRLASHDFDSASKSLIKSSRFFGLNRSDVDGDFDSMRKLIQQRFPKLDQ